MCLFVHALVCACICMCVVYVHEHFLTFECSFVYVMKNVCLQIQKFNLALIELQYLQSYVRILLNSNRYHAVLHDLSTVQKFCLFLQLTILSSVIIIGP